MFIGVDSEVVAIQSLSEDYSKFVLGCQDRSIEFHAQYGKHFKTRVPKNIRCLAYNEFTCDLLVGANSEDIYRLNLEEGTFLQSFKSGNSNVSALAYTDYLDLCLAAGDMGIIDIFDYRQRKNVAHFKHHAPVSQITFQPRGLQYLVGLDDGQVNII